MNKQINKIQVTSEIIKDAPFSSIEIVQRNDEISKKQKYLRVPKTN